MLSENVEKILDAEQSVRDLLEKTDREDAQSEEETRGQIREMIENKLADARAWAQKLLNDADIKSAEIYAEYDRQALQRIAVMNAEADARVPAAVQAVKDTILN